MLEQQANTGVNAQPTSDNDDFQLELTGLDSHSGNDTSAAVEIMQCVHVEGTMSQSPTWMSLDLIPTFQLQASQLQEL